MKREKISDIREIGILAAVIFDDSFLLELSGFFKPGLFSDEKIDWLVWNSIEYFKIYNTAPRFDLWAILLKGIKEEKIQKDEAPLYEKLLKKAESANNKGLQIPFLLSEVKTLLKSRSLEQLVGVVDDHLETGKHDEAVQAVETFSYPTTQTTHIIPLQDMDVVQKALQHKKEPLFSFKGVLGELVNSQLNRDSFIAFMGPEKRGKTWWLFEFAVRAIFSRLNVALFQVGDMSEEQGLSRIFTRLVGKPNIEDFHGTVLVPVFDCLENQDGTCHRDFRKREVRLLDANDKKPDWKLRPEGYKPCTACESQGMEFLKGTWFKEVEVSSGLTFQDVETISERLLRRTLGRQFRLSTHPNSSVSVSDIDRIIKRWVREGFTPDVVVIDYADILAPEKGSQKEFRHIENEKWKAMRRMSQVYNCLVITATQSDSHSYAVEDLSLSNFSEDKRKFGHVTGMLALNQTPDEKVAGVMRLGWLVLREGEFLTHKQVACLQCLKLGRPYLDGFSVDRR
jgi:hypothetical protein